MRTVLDAWAEGDHTVNGGELALLLSSPWGWPADRDARELAGELAPAPGSPDPGDVALVGYHTDLSGGSLWQLVFDEDDGDVTVPLGAEAEASLHRARLLAARWLTLLPSARRLREHCTPCARLLHRSGPAGRGAAFVDGESFGLSFVLAWASQFVGLPVPPHLAGTGRIEPDGSVGGIDGLAVKVRVVSDAALGVTRFLVPRSQVALAASVARRADLEIVGVDTVSDALTIAFPGMLTTLADVWRDDPGAAVDAARSLYDLALEDSPILLAWDGVERAAATLLGLALPADARWRAQHAHDIAVRHRGGKAVLDWPEDLAGLEPIRTRRTRLVAHIVQSGADGDDAKARTYAERALSELYSPSERIPEDYRVLGAIGRALASVREFDRAADALEMAVQGWVDEDRIGEVSRALCEMVRVRGLASDAVGLARAERDLAARAMTHDAFSAIDRAFLLLALGRAWVQSGDFGRGLSYLTAEAERHKVVWALVPEHLRCIATRWRVAALLGLGRREAAHAERATLPADGDHELLSRIDEALADADETALEALHAEVERHSAHLVEALDRYGRRGGDDPVGRLRALAREFPY